MLISTTARFRCRFRKNKLTSDLCMQDSVSMGSAIYFKLLRRLPRDSKYESFHDRALRQCYYDDKSIHFGVYEVQRCFYAFELSVLLNLAYFVLSSLARVRYLSLIAMFKSQQRTKTHGIAASLSALLERGESSVISGP